MILKSESMKKIVTMIFVILLTGCVKIENIDRKDLVKQFPKFPKLTGDCKKDMFNVYSNYVIPIEALKDSLSK